MREHRERGFRPRPCLSMVFGPHNILPDREQRMFARLLQGRPILIPGDGTALAQVGHVEDQARALRIAGGTRDVRPPLQPDRPDYFSAEAYVDTFAAATGVKPRKVYVPAGLMDDLYAGRASLAPGRSRRRSTSAARDAIGP